MRVVDFDGREHIFNLKKLTRGTGKNLSSYHKLALEKVEEVFPYIGVYNEVTLVGCKGANNVVLCADIFIPSIPIIIEVHGEQHYKYNKFFHKSEAAFKKALRNDRIKQDWCELNDITYLALKYNESDSWGKQIYDAVY